jgi:hypothetical protein
VLINGGSTLTYSTACFRLEARTQLVGRKPARMVKGSWSAPLAWLIAGAALIVALMATLPQPKPGFVPAAQPASQPPPQSSLPPVSIPRTAAIPQRPEPVQLRTPAPRAALVKLPPPRAALVRLPEWQPGTSRRQYMPYRLEVVGQLQGRLSDETLLPQSGNSIGDTWIVGNTPWVWITTPGTTSPQWIDP